jgi:hypothetical protein
MEAEAEEPFAARAKRGSRRQADICSDHNVERGAL